MSYSNYPPGVTESMIPGYNDRDISYECLITVTGSDDHYDNIRGDIADLLTDKRIDLNVEIKWETLKITTSNKDPDVFNWNIEVGIEGDISVDLSYVSHEEILSNCKDDIIEKLCIVLDHDAIDIDVNEIDYKVH